MYTMKQACDELGMPYATLRFYCDEGLVPNIKRNKNNNYREFSQRNLEWLKGLQCLKKCGMGIKDMKHYMELCLEGESTMHERKKILDHYKVKMLQQIQEIQNSISYINDKQAFYDGILSGKIKYTSNLIDVET